MIWVSGVVGGMGCVMMPLCCSALPVLVARRRGVTIVGPLPAGVVVDLRPLAVIAECTRILVVVKCVWAGWQRVADGVAKGVARGGRTVGGRRINGNGAGTCGRHRPLTTRFDRIMRNILNTLGHDEVCLEITEMRCESANGVCGTRLLRICGTKS